MDFEHIVYTDLDGTLLELESYDHSIASGSLQKLKAAGIPTIFCSSKTLAEQIHYQESLELNTPMIVENGAGIAIPVSFHPYFEELSHDKIGDYLLFSFAESYDFVLENIDKIRSDLNLELYGYHDLEPSEISKVTGLSTQELTRTTNRLFSETLIQGEFDSPKFKKLRHALFEVDLQCTPGSKFFTISDISSNKGKAIRWLNTHFKLINSRPFNSIGIGDSLNDLPMLAEVDEAFLVQKPDATWANIDLPNLKKINNPGPYGWNEIIEQHLGFS